MNVDQLLAIVEDLSAVTTTEQLENRLAQCQTACDQLEGESERQTEMLLAAIAKIQNKIIAIEFSEREKAQRALKAAASIPRERFTA